MQNPDPLASLPAALQQPLRACAQARLPPNVMLIQLAQICSSREELETVLQGAAAAWSGKESGRLQAALALWRNTPRAWDILRAVLDISTEIDHAGSADIESWSQAFDRIAEISPEAGVALYSLGRSDLLAEATQEIVSQMRQWGCLGRGKLLLEIGCGSGRFLAPLCAEAALVVGSDISLGMLRAARRQNPEAALLRLSGRDLAALRDACMDTVYAVDVFPYLVAAGGRVAARHVAEAGRVLKPGGQLLVFNYSYRDDPAADRADLEAAAAAAGLAPLPADDVRLRWWDGTIFRFLRS